jgi:signal transduction histidine kinase
MVVDADTTADRGASGPSGIPCEPVRLLGWDRRETARRAVVGDALLAVVLAVVLVAARAVEARGHSDTHHIAWLGYALAVVAGLLVAGRRRWPFAVFALTLSVAVVATGVDYASGLIALPVLVAVYTVARLPDWRRSMIVAVISGLGLALVRGFSQPSGWSDARTAAEPALVLAALFLGWAVSSHHAYIAEINARAERAERTREEEARRQVEAERLRIARELHDVVAHNIAMINVQAGVAAHVLDERPEVAAQALQTIKAASKATLRELRSVLGVLRQAEERDGRTPAAGLDQLDALASATSGAGLTTRVVICPHQSTLRPIGSCRSR